MRECKYNLSRVGHKYYRYFYHPHVVQNNLHGIKWDTCNANVFIMDECLPLPKRQEKYWYTSRDEYSYIGVSSSDNNAIIRNLMGC